MSRKTELQAELKGLCDKIEAMDNGSAFDAKLHEQWSNRAIAVGEALNCIREAEYEAAGQKYNGPDLKGKDGSELLGSLKSTIGQPTPRLTKLGQPGGPQDVLSRDRTSRLAARAHYCEQFGLNIDSLDNAGFSNVGEFFDAFRSGRFDQRLVALSSNESSGPAGGFFVPESFAAETLGASVESEIVLPRCTSRPMPHETLRIPSLRNPNNTSGETFSGLVGEWVPEGEAFTEQAPESRQVKLQKKKLGIFLTMTNELRADAPDYESQVMNALRIAVADARDYAFLRGTGAGQPRGVLNDPAKITVTKETNQTAATVVYENLAKMFARMHPDCLPRSAWVINPSSLPQLLSLSFVSGVSGQQVPVLQDNGGLRMLTRPVLLTSKLPALGTEGDVMLVDLSQYYAGVGPGISLEMSPHVAFQNDKMAYRVIWRGDGQGSWEAAYTPRNGDSLSWVVTLATRS